MIKKDIVIVGAGPAGSTAAYFLAGLGYDVLMLESKKVPRPKPCGDGIGPRTVLMLHHMGLDRWLRESNFYRIDQMRLVSQSGRSIISETSGHDFPVPFGYVIRRELFDYKLVRHASAGGADFLDEFRVEKCLFEDGRAIGVIGTHNNKTVKIKSRLVAAADGSTGSFSRLFGAKISEVHAIAYRGYAKFSTHLDRCANIFFSDRLPKGYGWIFPLSRDSANIGVGSLGVRNKKIDLKEAFLDFKNNTVTPICLKDAELDDRRQGSIMRMNFGKRPLTLPGIAFLGDAAGLVSPINGEGISHAMESGLILAESLSSRLDSDLSVDAALNTYDREMRRKFNSYFRWSRFLGFLLSRPRRLEKVLRQAEKDEWLAHTLTGILSNTIHPRELGRLKTIKRLLL